MEWYAEDMRIYIDGKGLLLFGCLNRYVFVRISLYIVSNEQKVSR